jgi:pimeloyl-ACP methyl ester carboxylesterase
MTLAVLLVHGIGDQRPEWAARIVDRLQSALHRAVQALDPSAPADAAVARLGAVHWAEVLQERQRLLRAQLDLSPLPQWARPPLWRLDLHTRRWYLRQFKSRERRFVAEFVGDVIGYPGPEAYPQVHATMATALEALAQSLPPSPEKIPLTLIGHSLGAVIASDHVYDARKRRSAGAGFHDRFQLENFFTLGSPQALFSLKYGGAEAFKTPIRMETPQGRWMNVFDPIDPIAMPLRGLNEAYAQAVAHDVQLNTGRWLDAHTRYFDEGRVLTLIARKLALDWATRHHRLTPPALQAAEGAYLRTCQSW